MTAIDIEDDVADLLETVARVEGYETVQSLLRMVAESYRDQQIDSLAMGR